MRAFSTVFSSFPLKWHSLCDKHTRRFSDRRSDTCQSAVCAVRHLTIAFRCPLSLETCHSTPPPFPSVMSRSEQLLNSQPKSFITDSCTTLHGVPPFPLFLIASDRTLGGATSTPIFKQHVPFVERRAPHLLNPDFDCGPHRRV